ncbi:MAG: hypothetical protein AAFX99_26580, partial [Myxococcota bacterium]
MPVVRLTIATTGLQWQCPWLAWGTVPHPTATPGVYPLPCPLMGFDGSDVCLDLFKVDGFDLQSSQQEALVTARHGADTVTAW